VRRFGRDGLRAAWSSMKGPIEQGRQGQRGFELVLEVPAAGRATEFDVSFEAKRR